MGDFMDSAVAKRYAKALFDLASEGNTTSEVRADLAELCGSLAGHSELSEACFNPMFGREEQSRVLDSVMSRQGCRPLVVRFVNLLLAKRRLRALHDISRFFGELVDRAQGVETVRVRSPRKMSDGDQARLRTQLESGLGRRIALSIEEDPKLLAGISVQVGSQVFDGTVRGKIAELRKAMVHEVQGRPSASS
jgi:F-type H+-transporting ATPase subunit delta